MADLPATALVLTYRRPRLATEVVRNLMDVEGLPADQIVLVVNGQGGLDDPDLESRIRILRLAENLGPAGGLARGLEHLHDVSETPWIYVCEDDSARLNLPSPRLADVIARTERFEGQSPVPVGAVLSSGWDVDGRTGRTSRHSLPTDTRPLVDVDYGEWWATLLSRRVLDAGVVPDETLFWWAEDLDFFLRVRSAGFRVLMDVAAARHRTTVTREPSAVNSLGREDEPWCSYYMARNPFRIGRRHGGFRWTMWHLLKSVRRFQLAPSSAHRAAIAHGLIDGLRGRTGKNLAFVREVGEVMSPEPRTPSSADG
ncbi:MAG: glycosyltransferase family 2 protein [Actinomycetota bacterium]